MRMSGLRFPGWESVSGGRQPSTSLHRTSTKGDGSAPKNTETGSVLEKFSPYTVSIFDACGFGFDRTDRDAWAWCFGASAARSGGRYFTNAGKGVMGFVGTGNAPGAFWLSNNTGGI